MTASPPKPKSRKPLLAALALLLIVLAAAILLTPHLHRESSYQGKPASYWLAYEDTNNPAPGSFVARTNAVSTNSISVSTINFSGASVSYSDPAEAAFKAMGSSAVPFLIKTLEHKPSRLARSIGEIAQGSDLPDWLKKRLPDPDLIDAHRARACEMLGALGPEAAPAIPTLARVLREADPDDSSDTSLQDAAAGVLSGLGESNLVVLPQLIENFKSTNESLQAHSADILGAIGPKAAAAVPALRLVASATNEVALFSARALLKINHDTNVLLNVCSNLLSQTQTQTNADLLHQTFASVIALGPAAKPLWPRIQPLLWDNSADSDTLRRDAESALFTIDPEALQSVQRQINADLPANLAKHIAILSDTNNYDSLPRTLQALAVLGPQAAPAVPELIKLLDAPPAPPVQTMPSTTGFSYKLGAMRISPGQPQPTMVSVGSTSSSTRYTISGLSASSTPAFPQIAPSPETEVYLHLLSACGLIPITENFQALGGPDADLDAAAAITLGQIGPESRAAVPKLITQLRSHSEHGSTPYSLALGAIGPAARDAIPLLEELLHSDTPETRLAAADALSRIAPELSSNLVAVVQPFLAERDSGSPTNNSSTVPVAPDEWRRSRSLFLSLQASVILWRLHVQKDPPVAQIIDAFAINTEPWFIGLLGDIGPAAKAALPNILIPLVQPGSTDSDDQLLLRPAAAIAIRKIDPATATRLNLPGTLALP